MKILTTLLALMISQIAFGNVAYKVEGSMVSMVINGVKKTVIETTANEEIVILVTDTPDKESDKKLSSVISEIPFLKHMSMTFAHDD